MIIPDLLVADLLARKEDAFIRLADAFENEKQDREAHEFTIEAARNNYCDDDIQIDDIPTLSVADDGVWVSARVWVPIESEDE